MPKLEAEEKAVVKELEDALATIPNLPLDEVPDGTDETRQRRASSFRARSANYGFAPKQHFELGEALGQMDFETAAKLSGARFVVLKSGLARMERALGQFMLDVHTGEHGYTEVAPPLLVRDDVMFGTAQLPKFRDDQFLATRTITRADMLIDALKYASDAGSEQDSDDGRSSLEALVDADARAAARTDEASLAHPHRRSPAHQSRARIHRRRSRSCRCGSPPARRASAPRPAPPARTPAA